MGEQGSMRKLSDEQRTRWAVDGYICLEQALDPDEVALLGAELDRMRQLPGWEPTDLPRGHYGWVERSPDLDVSEHCECRASRT